MKLEIKKKNKDKDMFVNRNMHVKFPKLAITKFEGTNMDFLRFWN